MLARFRRSHAWLVEGDHTVKDGCKATDFKLAADEIERLRAYADARVAQEREQIANALSDALSSDLENGVKWLNEMAADDFRSGYPALCAAIIAIRKEQP